MKPLAATIPAAASRPSVIAGSFLVAAWVIWPLDSHCFVDGLAQGFLRVTEDC